MNLAKESIEKVAAAVVNGERQVGEIPSFRRSAVAAKAEEIKAKRIREAQEAEKAAKKGKADGAGKGKK